MSKIIKKVSGHEVLDSRGNPTVAATVLLECGATGFASVPSGASTGKFEAKELRDKDKMRYLGAGVLSAVKNIESRIAPALKDQNATNQTEIDLVLCELDGTGQKENLGANATLAVSLAVARASANAYGMPLYRYLGGVQGTKLPTPMMNILNGGAHAANNIDIQEFMVVPVGAENFSEALRWCSEIYKTLGNLLKSEDLASTVGDEGGFAPNLSSDEEALQWVVRSIDSAGYSTSDVKIAIDAAASEWMAGENTYTLPKRKKTLTTDELIAYWGALCEKYPIISLEDALGEEDWAGWKKLTGKLGNKIQLVGDDLFVTNSQRLRKGIEKFCANSILIKPNQIGTLTETLEAISLAKKSGFRTVISHRSGETEDTFIADLAVATNAGQIKSGAPCRSDRVAKYNRLLAIEQNFAL